MPTRGAPRWEPARPDADTLPSGIALLDDVLSGKGLERGQLSVFVAGLGVGYEKTHLWRQLLEKHGAVTFDLEAGLDPEFIEQLRAIAKPPDDDNTT